MHLIVAGWRFIFYFQSEWILADFKQRFKYIKAGQILRGFRGAINSIDVQRKLKIKFGETRYYKLRRNFIITEWKLKSNFCKGTFWMGTI